MSSLSGVCKKERRSRRIAGLEPESHLTHQKSKRQKKDESIGEKNLDSSPQSPRFKVHTNLGPIEMSGKVLLYAMMGGQQPTFAGTPDEVVLQYNKFRKWRKDPLLTLEEEKSVREYCSKNN